MHGHIALDWDALDLACGGTDDGIDYSGFDPGVAAAPPAPEAPTPPATETSPPTGEIDYSGFDPSASAQPGTESPSRPSAFSDSAIERELGLGDRHRQPTEIASRLISDRDYQGQRDFAADLMTQHSKGFLLGDENRAALKMIQDNYDARVNLDASVYMKTSRPSGGVEVFTKESFGLAYRSDGPSGFYSSATSGVEVPLGGPQGPRFTPYGQSTIRTDRDDAYSQLGLKMEYRAGPFSAGVDVNTERSNLFVKAETPRIPLSIDGTNVRYGAEASFSARGSADARALARDVLERDAGNQRLAERGYPIPDTYYR